jgi:predicted nucleic-acid-binding protein
MKIIADTNLLVRAATDDDPAQTRIAIGEMAAADLVVVPLIALCEMVWVLTQAYGLERVRIAASIRALMNAEKVLVDTAATEAGLALLDAGGDFADGAIAFAGNLMGGETFVSFDKRAVRLISRAGGSARLAA